MPLKPAWFWFSAALCLAHSAPDAAATPQFTGNAPCRTCHPAIAAAFYRNPHFLTTASGAEPPERSGCEGCHGPASDHVAAKGGKNQIRAFSVMTARQTLDQCLRCHANTIGRSNIRRSPHTAAGLACTSCHSIHRSPTQKFLLAAQQRDVCYECHPNIRAQFSLPFKHRVNEGFMACTDCHNPHGASATNHSMGLRVSLVESALGNEEPCLKCHTDKRGPFAFEHPAVRIEGCGACHSPHGSAFPRLMKRPAVFTLCLECHNGAGAFGRQADGIKLTPSSHNLGDPRFRNCTTCHVRIHGSNSDRTFTR